MILIAIADLTHVIAVRTTIMAAAGITFAGTSIGIMSTPLRATIVTGIASIHTGIMWTATAVISIADR